MIRKGVRDAIVLVGVLASIGVAACVTSENRCVDGYRYVSQYNACAPEADASTDASSADAAPTTDAGENDGSGGPPENLGADCNGDADCAGKRASYCLKDPLAPSNPGVCSVPQCTAADCGTEFSCCDCGGASLPELQAWPRGICVPRSDAPTAQSLGCVCQ